MSSQDAIFAQLLGMGFDPEAIEECQIAMATTSEGFSMQAATEWLLQRSQQQRPAAASSVGETPPTLTLSPSSLPPPSSLPSPSLLPLPPDIQKAMSSGGILTSSQPLRSRYDLGEEHAREKDRYAAKERDEVIRKSKERRLADTKAKELIKQQIADDRKARHSRGKVVLSPTESTSGEGGGEGGGGGGGGRGGGGGGGGGGGEVKKSPSSSSASCRLQIRVPSGKVLRHSLPATALLSEVVQFVMTSEPRLTTVSLVQPFPHHQFSSEELNLSLLSLGLCPSASLVVSKQTPPSSATTGRSSLPSSQTSSTATNPVPSRGPRRYFGGPPLSHRGGHVLGRGNKESEGAEQMDVERVNAEIQPRDLGVIQGRLDENDSEDDEMEAESDDDDVPPAQILPHRPNFRPPFPNQPAHFGRRFPQMRPPRGPPMQFPGLPPLGGEEIFGGEGHKLGGKDVAVIGDAQLITEEGGRVAARMRLHPLHSSQPERVVRQYPSVPTLVSLCTRTLVGLTASYGMPSCASLPPRLAHILLDALRTEGRLNTKTLAAFHGCPLQSLILDNYSYATNDLIGALWHFPSLTQLSLSSCTIITDKAIAALFPYLSGLTDLNLEGCRQLTDAIFRSIRCCVSMQSLNLSHVKASDRGISLLLHSPLSHLTRLNLSHTRITSNTLTTLTRGAPALEELTIEATQVTDLTALCRLPRLHTLSIAHCSCGRELGSLSGCGQLHSLNLSGVPTTPDVLEHIKGLRLTSLTLPDRATFSDSSMKAISKFPLTSLDLMDYCYVSDVGVANVVSMATLTTLSLSKTKLTDTGMQSVAALISLRHLSVDNTVVTDTGLLLIAGLVCLESLSLADTRVTSGFILSGGLDRMGRLQKLNLSRTAVCDKGLLQLSLPSLVMLNLDWTCVTDVITLPYLQENGCPLLSTLRNRNIGQPLPGQLLQD